MKALALALALGLAFACAGPARRGPPPPELEMRYIVLRGDTLASIGRHYGVSAESIARRNGITDARRLEVGTELVIPSPRDVEAELARAWEEVDDGRPAGDLRFSWPLYGSVSSVFGPRWGRDHEGIDIRAESGTTVRAAEAGRVIHAGALGAYGNVVIVRHAGGWTTVYAHNRKNRVRKGDSVRKGDWIAEVGATGNATAPHLHFEVREKQAAKDPLRYLPTLVARRRGWSATR